MKNLFYYFIQALSEFRKRPLSHFFTLGSITLALTLAGGVTLLAHVMKTASEKWGSGAMVAVYMSDSTTTAGVESIREKLREFDGVRKTRVITRELSRKRLIQSLEGDASLIKSVENEFFPVSIEVVIQGDIETVGSTVEKIRKTKGIVPGIIDVRDVHTWNRKIGGVLDIAYLIGLLLLLLVLITSGYVIMVTTRLSVENRSGEMKIIQLLGASGTFVGAPVVIEGIILGLAGSLISTGLLALGGYMGMDALSRIIGESIMLVSIEDYFSLQYLMWVCLLGAVTGMISGKLALSSVRT
ncbi:MAG: hypothetical protein JXR95_15750 [Deltaproteobacteria bacterium]|nr:hypothetical protein [Deltaproteobacteria bacterium]